MLDIIIRIVLILIFLNGLRKGFLGSILGPISLLMTLGFCYFLFINGGNILHILIIGTLGPFFLTFVLSLLFLVWKKTVNKVIPISPVSRIAGAFFCLGWGCLYLFLIFSLIMRLPSTSDTFSAVQKAIRESQTYNFMAKFAPLPSVSPNKLLITMSNPESLKVIQNTDAFQDLMNNENFKEILSDPEVQELMKKKDIKGLISNKKVLSIMQDRELLTQLLKANQELIKQTEKNEILPDSIFEQKKKNFEDNGSDIEPQEETDAEIELYKEGELQ